MIAMNNTARMIPSRPPRGREHVPHEAVLQMMRLEISKQINLAPEGELLSTTRDGSDMVASFRVPVMNRHNQDWWSCLGLVNSNSGRQGCYVYGGVASRDGAWAVVMDRYPLRKRRTLQNVKDHVEDAVSRWLLFRGEYGRRLFELKNCQWSQGKTEYMMLECGRAGLITGSKVFCADQLWDGTRDHPITFLQRMCRVVWRHPPITVSPPRNQLQQLYAIYRRVVTT